MAKVIEASDPHAAWATMSVQTLSRILFYGLLVGALTFVAYVALDRLVFEPILCRDSAALARCDSKDEFAAGTAIILGSLLGLTLLVRERVYRPILAIIGVCVALWGVFSIVEVLPIALAAAVATILFALAYVLFSWLVQPTSLIISILGVVVVSTLARLAIG